MISQIYIFILAAIAAKIAYGLSRKQVMWTWIVLYWIVLTCKNFVDLLAK